MRRAIAPAVCAILALALAGCGAKVADKKIIQLNYTLSLPDGSVYATSIGEGKEPLEFMMGAGRMMPALEKELVGLRVNGKKKIVVKAADAYGDYDESALQEIPRDQLPTDLDLEVGATYNIQTPAGPMPVTLKSADDAKVVLDFNHPLAGKDLTFDVQVMKVRDATKDELAEVITEQSGEPQQPE
jgi:FKBP-type peptidyl-prolyl cis-trans isomerase 2